MTAGVKTKGKRRVYNLGSAQKGEKPLISYAYLIGLKAHDELSLVSEIESGFDFKTFIRLQKEIRLSTRELADLISITTRTLSRRRSEGRLKPDESDRLLRFARVFELVLGLFEGDKEAALDWLLRANSALKGIRPLDLSRTEVGAREVESLLFRLEHGVFA